MEHKNNINAEAAKLEHCPKCDSTDVKNNVYFLKGQSVRVYVQCAKCGEFVARYTLRGYTSDTIYESLLERLRNIRLSSGRRTLRIIEEYGPEVTNEYRHVLELTATAADQRRIEEIIADELDDEHE